jgi:hypothetical protein
MSKIADQDALTGKFYINIPARDIGVVAARVRDGVYLVHPHFSPSAPLAIRTLATVEHMAEWVFYEDAGEWSRAVEALKGEAA